MKQKDDGIHNRLNEVLSKYLFEPLDKDLIMRIQEEIRFTLLSLMEDSLYNDLISIRVFQKECDNLIFQPDNLFTLMYIHTGKLPPTMFMPNRGLDRDKFDWNGFKYSFIYDNNLDLHIPQIEELK